MIRYQYRVKERARAHYHSSSGKFVFFVIDFHVSISRAKTKWPPMLRTTLCEKIVSGWMKSANENRWMVNETELHVMTFVKSACGDS